jgi:hypothetical protein
MTDTHRRWAVPIALAAAALLATVIGTAAQTLGEPERFNTMAILGGGRGTAPLEIAITRWSTAAEEERLVSTLADEGQDKLLDVIRDAPKAGYIRTPGSVGWDLRFAQRIEKPDGGERVLVITDRPVGFFEQVNQLRTLDYPFSVVTLDVKADREGEGALSMAARLAADKESKSVIVENIGYQPIQLVGVERQK